MLSYNLNEQPWRDQSNETEMAIESVMVGIEYEMIQIEEPATWKIHYAI